LQASATGQSQWSGIIMIVAMVAIFYFFMIRPQQKKQKIYKRRVKPYKRRQSSYVRGIYGKIKEIGDIYMIIEIADGVKIKVDKTSIFASTEDAK
jgi:preprotein translocase subunit YajC